MMTNRRQARSIVNYLVVLAYLAMIGTNALANILPINGITTGEVSDSYPNLFAPAGLTFSIWGVIYFLLAGYAVYQLVVVQKGKRPPSADWLKKIGILFILSSLADISWILAWHYRFIGLSTILIASLLVCLILINQSITQTHLSKLDKIFIRLPFSIYFGWITVATIANVTTLLVDWNWNGWGLSGETWTIIILIVGVLIGITTMLTNKDIVYGLTLLWAYFGIGYKHLSASGFDGDYPLIIATVAGTMVALAASGIYLLVLRKKRAKQYY